MKNSNSILTGLIILVMACMVFTDFALKNVYARINMSDPFKNYETIAVKPFRFLKIKGGNGYSVSIKQNLKTDMKVMSTRRSFLHFKNIGDTLLILFAVMNNRQGSLAGLPVGLMISSPAIAEINTDGTSNLIQGWQGETLKLTQTGNAASSIVNLKSGQFTASGNQSSVLSFQKVNKVNSLNLNLKDSAAVYLQAITYQSFTPVIKNGAQLIFSAATASGLKRVIVQR